MSFFNELKRRNVFRVGAAYLVVAWLLVQVIDTLGDLFELPNVFGQGIVILLAIGFPIALVVSWIYEVTPEGITTQDAVDAGVKTTSGRKLNTVIIGGLALALVLVVLDAYVLDGPTRGETSVSAADGTAIDDEIVRTASLEKSIAVLPFVNQSNDPDQEYFSDGLTEELINTLSQLQDLLVIGRNSSFYFKDSDASLEEIGEQLNVSYILQGSVRKNGNQLRVTAQLVTAQSGFNLWSRNFDRAMADIFVIQDEIAREVTENLSISLGVGEFDRQGMTRNVAAYDAYLRGRKVLDEIGLEPEQAIRHFEEAVALDPDFAQGWWELSGAYRLGGMNSSGADSQQYYRLRDEARERAAALVPETPETRAGSAAESFRRNNNRIAAAAELQSLVAELGFNNANINLTYAGMLVDAGKFSEALPYYQRARRLNPLSAGGAQMGAVMLLVLGREEEALAEVERGLSFDQAVSFQFLHAVRTIAAYQDDSLDRAIAMLRMNSPGQPEYDLGLPVVEMLAAGDREGTIARLREILASGPTPIERAILQPVAALTGDADLAVAYMLLRNENVGGQIGLWMPYSRPYLNEPAMKQRLRDSGLVDFWKTAGWPDFCRPIAGAEDDFECF